MNEISQDPKSQPQDMPQQNIQQQCKKFLNKCNKWIAILTLTPTPQHLNPQPQLILVNFTKKGYQSVPFYEQILSEAESPLVVAVIFLCLVKTLKMIVGLSEKLEKEAGVLLGLVLVSLLAGVSYWGVNRMINKN